MNKVMVISAHPDDETLGCGGTLLKHSALGDDIYWVIFTEPNNKYPADFIIKRDNQIKNVGGLYNVKETVRLGYPTTTLHSIDFTEIINGFSKIINNIKPDIIYTVNRSDVHTDHQVVAKVISSCTKPFRYPFIKRILMYECISETEMAFQTNENIFIPNVFSDISEYIEMKEAILKIYDTEIQKPPFPRSIENVRALARFRGSTIGVNFAEAFMLIRDIF